MTLRRIGSWLLRRWPIVGGVFILTAFALGVALGNPQTGDSQEHTDPEMVLDHMEMIATPVVPYPTIDMTRNPIRVEKVRGPVISIPTVPAATNAGTTTRPLSGNYLQLPRVGRYYSFPDDVELIEKIDLGSCNLYAPICPIMPLYVYQRGNAKISIDSIGRTFDTMPGGDASAFPFFTGKDEESEK